MKYGGWILAGVLGLAQVMAGGSHQARISDLTWPELRAMQNAERIEFLKTQANALDKCLENQKAEVTNTSGLNSNAIPALLEKLRGMKAEERKELMRIQGAERQKELETWSTERKAYFSGR